MTDSARLAELLERRRVIAEELRPLADRTAQPRFRMSDEEFDRMDRLGRELEDVNREIAKLGGPSVGPGPATRQ